MKQQYVDIETIKVQPDDYVVCRFNTEKLDIGTTQEILNTLCKEFPNNTVIAFPDSVSLQTYNKETLKKWISNLQKIVGNTYD